MDLNARHILLVEGDPELRKSCAEQLRQQGYLVTGAQTAEEGLEFLRCVRVDGVVSEYLLPARTGVWLVREAEAQGLLRRAGCLLVTSRQYAHLADGVPVLLKPAEPSEFLAAVSIASRLAPRWMVP